MESTIFNGITMEEYLKDAGCSWQLIESVMTCMHNQENEEMMRMLREYRCDLLEKIHQDQKQIDCLDDLLYQFKQVGCK